MFAGDSTGLYLLGRPTGGPLLMVTSRQRPDPSKLAPLPSQFTWSRLSRVVNLQVFGPRPYRRTEKPRPPIGYHPTKVNGPQRSRRPCKPQREGGGRRLCGEAGARMRPCPKLRPLVAPRGHTRILRPRLTVLATLVAKFISNKPIAGAVECRRRFGAFLSRFYRDSAQGFSF